MVVPAVVQACVRAFTCRHCRLVLSCHVLFQYAEHDCALRQFTTTRRVCRTRAPRCASKATLASLGGWGNPSLSLCKRPALSVFFFHIAAIACGLQVLGCYKPASPFNILHAGWLQVEHSMSSLLTKLGLAITGKVEHHGTGMAGPATVLEADRRGPNLHEILTSSRCVRSAGARCTAVGRGGSRFLGPHVPGPFTVYGEVLPWQLAPGPFWGEGQDLPGLGV